MVPQFAHHDERIKVFRGKNTEVSYPHANARKASMQELVKQIKGSKHKRLRPAASFRKNGLCAMNGGIGAQELRHAIGCIFSIGIHHHHCITVGGLVYVYQPDGDCPLMAKIAAHTQSPYASHRREATLEVVMVASFHRAIVNQQNLYGA